jgi:hypothetical protein
MDGLMKPYWRQSRDVLAQCLTRVQADRVRAVPDSDLAVGLEIVEEALADLLQVLTLELEETQGGHT